MPLGGLRRIIIDPRFTVPTRQPQELSLNFNPSTEEDESEIQNEIIALLQSEDTLM
jgi:hypothetical protein